MMFDPFLLIWEVNHHIGRYLFLISKHLRIHLEKKHLGLNGRSFVGVITLQLPIVTPPSVFQWPLDLQLNGPQDQLQIDSIRL